MAKLYTHGFDNTGGSLGGGFGVSPDVHLNYRLVGEWERANYMFRRFPTDVKRGVNLATRKVARKYRRKVIENIRNQGAAIGWEPITSEKYRKFKESKGEFSVDTPLQFFGSLLQNIKTFKHGQMGWSAGIKAGIRNEKMDHLRKGNSLSVSEYAGVLEHGSKTRNIRPRPLWTPSWRHIGGNKQLVQEVANTLRALYPSRRLKLPTRIGRAKAMPTAKL